MEVLLPLPFWLTPTLPCWIPHPPSMAMSVPVTSRIVGSSWTLLPHNKGNAHNHLYMLRLRFQHAALTF